ncbi:hypothetical protein D3C76_971570 [compost metagenome]
MGRAAGHERGAGDVQCVVADGAKHPQAGLWRIAREQHHFHRQLIGECLVDAEEAADEREGDPFRERFIQVLLLVLAVSLDAFGLVDVVRHGEVEECAGGHADDQFVFDGVGHERAP